MHWITNLPNKEAILFKNICEDNNIPCDLEVATACDGNIIPSMKAVYANPGLLAPVWVKFHELRKYVENILPNVNKLYSLK